MTLSLQNITAEFSAEQLQEAVKKLLHDAHPDYEVEDISFEVSIGREASSTYDEWRLDKAVVKLKKKFISCDYKLVGSGGDCKYWK